MAVFRTEDGEIIEVFQPKRVTLCEKCHKKIGKRYGKARSKTKLCRVCNAERIRELLKKRRRENQTKPENERGETPTH